MANSSPSAARASKHSQKRRTQRPRGRPHPSLVYPVAPWAEVDRKLRLWGQAQLRQLSYGQETPRDMDAPVKNLKSRNSASTGTEAVRKDRTPG